MVRTKDEQENFVKEIMDNAEIWVGQCWKAKDPITNSVYPEKMVVTSMNTMGFGQVSTTVTRPVGKMGNLFQIRADMLVEFYDMEYDHATHLGQTEQRIENLRTALFGIIEGDVKVGKALANQAIKLDDRLQG